MLLLCVSMFIYLFIFYIVENARHETVFMELLHQYVKISIYIILLFVKISIFNLLLF